MKNNEVCITTKNTISLTLGLIALITGVLCLFVGWMPYVGVIALPFATIGCLLALIGFIAAVCKQGKGIAMPLVGGIVCVAAFLFPLFVSGSTTYLINESVKSVKAEGERKASIVKSENVSDITWDEIDAIYRINSDYTRLQKNEYWKKYEGKKVKWSGEVSSITETFGQLVFQIKMRDYSMGSDLVVKFNKDEREKALKFREGDTVTFIAVLKDWGTIVPITLSYGEVVE